MSAQHLKLAKKYAPLLIQKVNKEWKVADQIAPVDFAGSITDVSKNHQKLYDLDRNDTTTIKPKIYFSVCETTTHFFIIYAVYHIVDWWKRLVPNNLIDRFRYMLENHFHDMEGALFVITRHPEGLIDGVITVAHRNFYLYTEPVIRSKNQKDNLAFPERSLRITKFRETIDGHIEVSPTLPRVYLYIQSNGHGIRCDRSKWSRGEEVWYYRPKGISFNPDPDPGPEQIVIKHYQLENIFKKNGLWDNRFNNMVFLQDRKGKWGFVYQNKKGVLERSPANPPWSWNDRNDPSPIGEIATDPAHFILRYAQGWGPVSTQYISNPYLSIGDHD